ncbi:MAG TPA: cytochrome P450 [Solirubrobacterales bacterium]|jgi:cytochrome P450|nr:cytochrome P450 [Solirubrobacterales bacterium]
MSGVTSIGRLSGRRGRPGPALDLDLYAPAVVEDSSVAFAAIRDAGPVVWLPRHRMWALGRFDEVRTALRDDEIFVSGKGVAANPITNVAARKTTLFSDGETHVARRKVLMRSLGAQALAPIAGRLDAEAEAIVGHLVGRGEFDAARDFSSGLPLEVVADLVGVRVPAERLLSWGTISFDVLGPLNRRGLRAFPSSLGMLAYAQRLDRSRVIPGSWAETVFDAADRGEIDKTEARNMVIDFIAPSLDTTILASTYMLWLLAENPEAWERIRRDPGLIPAAVVESVRLSSPIRGFTRRLSRAAEVAGVRMRAGDRTVLLVGAANLDERHYPDPERFDLERPPGGNLGWGNGPHTCVGIHLAKLEMAALLRALVAQVETIEIAGPPARIRNNTLQGIGRLPVRLS